MKRFFDEEFWGLFGLFLLVGLMACGPQPPSPPSPAPSPSAPPTPPAIVFPLGVSGTEFVDATGKPVTLAGAIECCESTPGQDFGWPMVSYAFLDAVAEAGGNYVHVRVGPMMQTPGVDPRSTRFRAYATAPNGRADLNAWNPSFWAEGDALIKHAASKGIVVEVSLLDAWSLKEGPQDEIRHPWCARNNNLPFNQCYASILSKYPHAHGIRLVKKTVEEWGDNLNVIWEDSNEAGVPGRLQVDAAGRYEPSIRTWLYEAPEVSSLAGPARLVPEWEVSVEWTRGIVVAVREAEAQFGYVNHLFGTNTERPGIESKGFVQYINKHERFASLLTFSKSKPSDPDVRATKPVVINEYPRLVPDIPVPPGTSEAGLYRIALDEAVARQTYLHLWRGDDQHGPFTEKLAVLKAFHAANGGN